MKCPFCFTSDSFVKDSRTNQDGMIVRRRRYCSKCKAKFTTFEKVQLRDLKVVKKSGSKKIFDREKVYKSIAMALRKRNVTEDQINEITDNIVVQIKNSTSHEILTQKIGELIMSELAKVDQVAYIRFASVYKDFSNAKDFAKFIDKLNK